MLHPDARDAEQLAYAAQRPLTDAERAEFNVPYGNSRTFPRPKKWNGKPMEPTGEEWLRHNDARTLNAYLSVAVPMPAMDARELRKLKAALKANPKNIDAARELRIADMRSKKRSSVPPAPKAGESSLLKKLFGGGGKDKT